MKYHLVNLLLVAAAVVCYFVGFGEGIVPMMAAYFVLELTIAFRIGSRRKLRRQASRQSGGVRVSSAGCIPM